MDYFNFCHFSLNPSVTSSAVSAEGHEVTNLISNDISKQRKGFMVYRTINPPVDVTFTFMCKINISHIIIWPQVGNQKSSGFQVSTNRGKPGLNCSNNLFVNVGTAFLQNEPGIVFHHAHEPTSSNTSSFLHRRLTSRQNGLSAVRSVQIRIFKTLQSSVPSILNIEIWGLPSASCPKEVRMKVLDLWTQKDKKVHVKKEVSQSDKKSELYVLRSTAMALVNKNFEIPEDFIDPITCEIMVLPFVLPSGKMVDQRTLDKHENHEANWGRRPSDPFTGKFYTDTAKPILATALKARIDKFLIEHANVDELKKVPRTVGRKLNSSSGSKESNVVVAKDEIQQNSLKNIDKKMLSQDENPSENKQQMLSFDKRKAVGEFLETENKRLKIEVASSSRFESAHSNMFDSDLFSSVSSSKSSHEDLLNDSLDAALKSALSGLPSFTNFTPKIQVQESKCSFCSEKEVLYVLPCQHLLCRTCLTKNINDKICKCSNCNLPFNSADPKRYFP